MFYIFWFLICPSFDKSMYLFSLAKLFWLQVGFFACVSIDQLSTELNCSDKMLKSFLLAFSQWTSFLVVVSFPPRLLSGEELRQDDPVLEEEFSELLLSNNSSYMNNNFFFMKVWT